MKIATKQGLQIAALVCFLGIAITSRCIFCLGAYMAKQDYSRNTPMWGLDILRQDALPRLLDDLGETNIRGIPETICKQVKATHDKMTDLATVIPDKSLFRKSVWQAFQEYADAYAEWNDVDGETEEAQVKRRKALKKVRAKRNGLATIIRKNKHILANELDIALIDDMYKALGNLAQNAPEYFGKLAEAIARYQLKRVSGDGKND